ncbi:MAG: hypothetical protein C0405_13295, partial [Desulfovibrio sp.]|nr:hypothetical protein [Desulfovibrio sp.]
MKPGKPPDKGLEAEDSVYPLPVALPDWMPGAVFTGYLAAPGFLRELMEELELTGASGPEHLVFGDLIFTIKQAKPAA